MNKLGREAENDLIRLAQAGDNGAKTALLEQYKNAIWKMALKAAPHENDVEDFVQMASIYFLQAVDKFDVSVGTKFITCMYSRVPLQLIREYHEDGLIRVPASSKHIKASINIGSIHATTGDDDSDTAALLSDGRDFDGDIDTREDVAIVRRAIQCLDARHRVIIEGRMSGQTLEEIGKQLGLTKERVRQLEVKANKHLRELLTNLDSINLPRRQHVRWTDAELSYLRNHYGKKHSRIIASAMGRGHSAVMMKITALDLRRERRWTAMQDAFLRANHEHGWQFCASQLGRSTTAIHNRVRRIGIALDYSSPDMTKVLELHSQGFTTIGIGLQLGYSDECIRNNLKRMGIKPNKRNEQQRMAARAENDRKKWGTTKLHEIRAKVWEDRAGLLGYRGTPISQAMVLAAVKRIGRPATAYELQDVQRDIAKEFGFFWKGSWRSILKEGKQLAVSGRLSRRYVSKKLVFEPVESSMAISA